MFLSALLSLIRKIVDILFGQKQKEVVEERYTREDFTRAVSELSNIPRWRARILKDALLKLRSKYVNTHVEWIDKDRLTFQTLHRDLSCGLTYSFGDGIYAIPKDTMLSVIKDLQQNAIKYVSELTDCDNFATFFKGFADFVVGKSIVIYTTGLVFQTQVQFGRKVCICKSDYLLGGHAWNRIAILEPITYQKIGTIEEVTDEFTIITYEPQNDEISVNGFLNNGYCYRSGGGLPTIYDRR